MITGRGTPDQVSSSSSMSPPRISGDVGVFLLGFLDEGGVVEALVHLDLLLDVGNLFAADPFFFPCASASASSSEMNSASWVSGSSASCGNGARGRLGTAPALRDRRDFVHRAAFRAGDRIVVKIVELCAARGAEAFRAELGFRHGRKSLRQVEKRTSPWRLARPVSIAPAHAGRRFASDQEKPDRRNRCGKPALCGSAYAELRALSLSPE